MTHETAYEVTVYRDTATDASVDTWGMGWWHDEESALRLAKREIMNDPEWLSATIDEVVLTHWYTDDGIEMTDTEIVEDGRRYALLRRDGEWVEGAR